MTTKTKNKKTMAASSWAKQARASKLVAKPKARAKATVKPKAPAKLKAKAKTAKTKTAKANAKRGPKLKVKRTKAAAKPASKSKTEARRPSAKPKRPAPAKAAPRAPKPKVKAEALPKSAAKPAQTERDWSATLFLPKTDFPMKAGLPEREPELLKRWELLRLYRRLREAARGREKFILHDGPPYANGHLHIGHALNKILKDVITRSQQMMGKDPNYVPGWDCHGLPIEWKVEEDYRAKGQNKDEVPINEFREVCRAFAAHWIGVQREEFKRLGVEGDWQHPYTTMSFDAEATIARELMQFAMNGLLYRGSKPVMWSVVEQTALAEAEVEYQEITSPTIFVRFPIADYAGPGIDVGNFGPVADIGHGKSTLIHDMLSKASVVIWTTTPWTIPGNRAIAFSQDIDYGLYEVTGAPPDNWARVGDKLLLADALAENVRNAARIEEWTRVGDVPWVAIEAVTAAHPLRGQGYDFDVPLLAGEHVTEDTGTGFVHTAPGHGTEDFEIWEQNRAALEARGIDTTIPFTVDANGYFTREAPGFEGKRVIDDRGKFGDANEAVIQELIKAGALVARGRLRHDYPHSWRSKKPVIFRNTPQWFIAMDSAIRDGVPTDTLRNRALAAISETRFVPPQGEKRIRGMIETRPDWVVSRQRAWGVPITVFRNTNPSSDSFDDVAPSKDYPWSEALIERIVAAFEKEGADAWFKERAKERFLSGLVDDPHDWEKVDDILDVWFDSGSTHAFVLEKRPDLQWPASLYLEGSDQHRGWFQSSLLESCGTRGRAPFDAVLTHGFVVYEEGRKMSKSSGNVVAPQDVIGQSGAEILRLWAMSSDYTEDLRIGPEIIKANVESYRKLRNTLRFLLGNLAHDEPSLHIPYDDMPELERYILSRLVGLDAIVRAGYDAFDFKRIFHALFNFCVNDLSAFYFDIRKDALYCDPYDSLTRRASLTVLDTLFAALTAWLAPMLCFTMEEAWLNRFPEDKGSVHLRQFPTIPAEWRDDALAEKWRKIRQVRPVVTGALEIERKERRIGSSLEAAPKVFVEDRELRGALDGVDLAEVTITSGATLLPGGGPEGAFRLDEVPGVAVEFERAKGKKCARSWKILEDVGADPEFPDLTPRDAEAVRQFDARQPTTVE
jgi:isoleucyl-tRNA synthetase